MVTLQEFIHSTGKWRVKLRSGVLKDLKAEFLVFEKEADGPPRPVYDVRLEALKAQEKLLREAEDQKAKLVEAKRLEELQTLRPGSKVRLHSLKGAPQLNGQVGVLEEFIQQSGRWRVKVLTTLETKDLKPENIA